MRCMNYLGGFLGILASKHMVPPYSLLKKLFKTNSLEWNGTVCSNLNIEMQISFGVNDTYKRFRQNKSQINHQTRVSCYKEARIPL